MTGGIVWLVSTRVASEVAALVFLKGSAVFTVAFVAGRLARRRSAAFRHRIWTLALLGLLVLPVVGLLLPSWGSAQLLYPEETPLVGVESVEVSAGVQEAPAMGGADVRPPTGFWKGYGPVPLMSALLLLWWAGVIVLGTGVVMDLIRAGGLRWRSTAAADHHPATRMLERERVRLGIHREVRLLLAGQRGLAATVGTLRPGVALGSDVAALPERQLRSVLLHELAHVRRGDFLTNLLGAVAALVYWPNPLYWIARRSAAVSLEQACDDEVLGRGVRPSDYAKVLMHFVAMHPGLSPAMKGSPGLLRFSPTRDRIHSILDRSQDRAPIAARSGVTMAALGLALVLPVGSFGLLDYAPGTGTTEALVTALSSADPAVRWRAATTLGRRDPASVRLEMEALVDDPASEVRLAAMGAIEQAGDPRSLPVVARVLRRPFDGGRGEHGFVLKLAMKTAGRIDSPEAVRVLEAQLDRPVAPLRWLALEEISGMAVHGAAAIPHLSRFAENDPNERNRRLAAEVLVRLGS